MDLLHDRNAQVAKAADRALDIVMDTNEQWAIKLRGLKFEAHNQEWLDVTEHLAARVSCKPGSRNSAAVACLTPAGI